MTTSEFKRVARILKESYKELEAESLETNLDIFSAEYKELQDKLRVRILTKLGFTLEEYRAAKDELESIRVSNVLKDKVFPVLEKNEAELQSLKDRKIPTNEEISELAKSIAEGVVKPTPPQIINKIVKETIIEKPQIIEKTFVVDYDERPLNERMAAIAKRLDEYNFPAEVNVEQLKEDLRGDFGRMFEENINILGMPNFRKLAMGLQAQIDELRTNGTGGGGTPGGSNTEVQFNDGGAFGGDPNFVWDKTFKILTVQGSTNDGSTVIQSWKNFSGTQVALIGSSGDGSFNNLAALALGNGVMHNVMGSNFSVGPVVLTTEVSGILPATNGGTGTDTYAVGDLLYASTTTDLSKLPISTNGFVLTLAAGLPSWVDPTTALDSIYIRRNGTTTTTAKIPFAVGIRIDALQTIEFGDSGSVVSRMYSDGIDTYLEGDPSMLNGGNTLISANQNASDSAGGSVYLYGAEGTGELPLTNGGVWTGNSPTGRPTGTLGNTNIGDLGVNGYLVVAQYAQFNNKIFVGTNSGIAVGVADIALGGNTAKSIGVERAAGLVSTGQALSINAGGSKTGTTNISGGNLTLSPGAATGTGTASVIIQATGGGSSGTSNSAPTTVATFAKTTLTLVDAYNIVLNTTTGTKIGTGTTQKLGFFNATPIVQPGATTDLGTVLSDLGLRAAGTAYPLTTSGAVAFSGTIGLSGQVTVADAINFALNATTGTKIGTATTQKLGFWNATPVVRPAAYTPTNVTTDRSYDANSTTLDEVADVLGTLIADLQSIGLIG